MAYDLEKEKREAIDAGNRALKSLRNAQDNLNSAKKLGTLGYVWMRIYLYHGKTLQNGQTKTKHGTGEI